MVIGDIIHEKKVGTLSPQCDTDSPLLTNRLPNIHFSLLVDIADKSKRVSCEIESVKGNNAETY